MSATELKLEEAMYFDFCTHRFDTGAAADADSGPTAEVFEDATDTTVVALTVTKRTSKTGNYRCPVTAAAADGFEVGKTYNVIASATVNSVTGKGVIGRFKVRARGKDDLAYPATSGRSMVVDAAGLVDANAVKVGPSGSGTAQTAGDIPARLPAALTAGGNIKADALALSGDTVAADNAESFFDGTGYAGTNNVVPLVTTTTNLTTNNDKTGYAIGVGGIGASAFAAGAIDNAAIAADAIGSSELATTAVNEIRDAIFARAFAAAYSGLTFEELIKVFAAALGGKASGLATTTATYRNLADTGDVIVATVDPDGNRTAVTLTP